MCLRRLLVLLALAAAACSRPQAAAPVLPITTLRMESVGSNANDRRDITITVMTGQMEGRVPGADGGASPETIRRELSQDELRPLKVFVYKAIESAQPCAPKAEAGSGNSIVIATDGGDHSYVLGRNATGAANQTCVLLSETQHQELFRLFPTR